VGRDRGPDRVSSVTRPGGGLGRGDSHLGSPKRAKKGPPDAPEKGGMGGTVGNGRFYIS
jgi:hypothetical protein